MASPSRQSAKLRFGAFEVEPATARLLKAGLPVKLPPQPFKVLLLLLDRPGEIVHRQEIQECLWGTSTFVDFERGINFSINQIRAALCDNAENPRYIETLPRIGYRFVAPVTVYLTLQATARQPPRDNSMNCLAKLEEQLFPRFPPDEVHASKATLSAKRRYLFFTMTGVLALVLVTIVIIATVKWSSRFSRPDWKVLQVTRLTDSGRAQMWRSSPDGRYVVYSLGDADQESLHLRQVATRSDVEILPPGPAFHGLTFSRDGVYVYFVRSDPNEPYFKYLYSVPALGGPARRMIADVDSPVSFSPDGGQFVFERAAPSRNVVELRIANADGSGEHVLATIQNGDAGLFQPGPSWSWDGHAIVCPFRILGQRFVGSWCPSPFPTVWYERFIPISPLSAGLYG